MCTVDGEFGIYSNAMCHRGLFPFFPVLIQAIAVDSYLAAMHSFLLGRGLSLRFFSRSIRSGLNDSVSERSTREVRCWPAFFSLWFFPLLLVIDMPVHQVYFSVFPSFSDSFFFHLCVLESIVLFFCADFVMDSFVSAGCMADRCSFPLIFFKFMSRL
jgi:hypothetical protein